MRFPRLKPRTKFYGTSEARVAKDKIQASEAKKLCSRLPYSTPRNPFGQFFGDVGEQPNADIGLFSGY